MERRDEVRSDADAGGDCDPSAVDEHVEMRMDVERRALPTQSRQTQRAEARAQTVRVRGPGRRPGQLGGHGIRERRRLGTPGAMRAEDRNDAGGRH